MANLAHDSALGDRDSAMEDRDSAMGVPLSKLYLTDYDEPRRPEPDDHLQVPPNTRLASTAAAENVATLKALGAKGPFYKISGFETKDEAPGDIKDFRKLLEEPNIMSLVIWGSPHYSWQGNERQSVFKDSAHFKTCSFESIAWLAPTALTAMTFGSDYEVEFYHPYCNKSHYPRQLIVAELHTRCYAPIASGAWELRACEGHTTMVAMLVPERYRHCLTYESHKLDLGATCAKVLMCMSENECAIELGGQTFSL